MNVINETSYIKGWFMLVSVYLSAAIYWVNTEMSREEEVALVKHTLPARNLNEVYKHIVPLSTSFMS